jgi:hypothetical protein
MKKIILATGLMLTLGLTGAFAKDRGDINAAVTASFSKDFGTAENVNWERQRDFIKATFSLNNMIMFAYYQPDGELLAVSRNLLSDQLPIYLRGDLKKNYRGYWINDLFELAAQEQTSYYISMENADEILVLKSNGYNGWIVYKKQKKIAI